MSRFTDFLCLECDRPLTQEEQDGTMLCEHCDQTSSPRDIDLERFPSRTEDGA